MLSLPKLVILGIVFYLVWSVLRRGFLTPNGRKPAMGDGASARPPAAGREAADLTRCTACGTYVAGACERADCPIH